MGWRAGLAPLAALQARFWGWCIRTRRPARYLHAAPPHRNVVGDLGDPIHVRRDHGRRATVPAAAAAPAAPAARVAVPAPQQLPYFPRLSRQLACWQLARRRRHLRGLGGGRAARGRTVAQVVGDLERVRGAQRKVEDTAGGRRSSRLRHPPPKAHPTLGAPPPAAHPTGCRPAITGQSQGNHRAITGQSPGRLSAGNHTGRTVGLRGVVSRNGCNGCNVVSRRLGASNDHGPRAARGSAAWKRLPSNPVRVVWAWPPDSGRMMRRAHIHASRVRSQPP